MATTKLRGADGSRAVVGKSLGYWLDKDDFVSYGVAESEPSQFGTLGFPRDWPAAYRQNPGLKALLGKQGSLRATRVAVAGLPTAEERAQLPLQEPLPLQSFANAEAAAGKTAGASVVRGWAVFERLDLAPGAAFVAERHWWNALPGGAWIDLTPRPKAWDRLLLAEAAENPPKQRVLLTAEQLRIAESLLERRFPQQENGVPLKPSPLPRAISAAEEKVNPAPKPAAPKPAVAKQTAAPKQAAPPRGKKAQVDYSKFDNIADSDDEKPVAVQETMALPLGLPREAVSRKDYEQVWRAVFKRKDLPFTPAPDIEIMWGFYRHGGMDEQALLDQACELLAHIPCRLDPSDFKEKTYSLTKKLELAGREDEARMWSIIYLSRFPRDPDGYYNQGVLLNKMCDKVKFAGGTVARLPSHDGAAAKTVPVEQYCALFSRAAVGYYRKCITVDPKQRPAYINLIGCLERNEPSGWYEEVHKLAATAVKNSIWYNIWQRPPHFVPSLMAKPWHDAADFQMCAALHEHAAMIRQEYDAYIKRLTNRKDWDDSDNTPGLGDVGGREGALHDGGLCKSGRWREVPLFANCTLNRDYAVHFPGTVEVLKKHCADAVGLALCGGGDVIFSVLTPGTRLRPHCGPSNTRLTCHLGVHVPRTEEQGCYVRVAADAPRGWVEGRCIVFDDSFEHEVAYGEVEPSAPYPGERVVLLANFWHPNFEHKNDPDWRTKSDPVMAKVEVESLPQNAVVKVA